MEPRIRLSRRARVHYDRHSGQTMLLYPERGLVLNESARQILERCDGTRTLEALIDDLTNSSGGARDVIDRDVRTLLEDLRRRSLIEDICDP